jgi:hypothetical protein
LALTETIFLGDLQIKMVSLVVLSVYFYQAAKNSPVPVVRVRADAKIALVVVTV